MDLGLPSRTFGKTGLDISPLQLGTVKFGRTAGLKYPDTDGFELPDDAALARLLDVARACGVNALDTAPAYGVAEERIGQLLAGPAGAFHIFTKVGEIFDGATSRFDFSAAHTRQSVEESLRRLRVPSLAGVALHCPDEDLDALVNSDALETLAKLRDAGHIRSIGASTKTVEAGLRAAELCDYVMVALSADDRSQEPVIARARDCGAAVVVKKGFAAGNALGEDPRAGVRRHIEAIFKTPGVHGLAVGTANPDHLRDNAAAVRDALSATPARGGASVA